MSPPTTHLAKLQAWAEERRKNGLEEFAFYPGSDREISREDAAWVALQLIDNFENGREPRE